MTNRNRQTPTRRRGRAWAPLNESVTLAAGATSDLNILQDFETALGANAVLGATVIRIRGSLWVHPEDFVSDELIKMRAGIAVGGSGLDGNPYDSELSWMWRDSFIGITQMPGVTIPIVSATRIEVDSKAQRKLAQVNENLYLRLKNDDATNGITIVCFLETLLLLP